MYFSRLTPQTPLPLPERGWDLYFMHKLLWRFFGDHPDRRRDFLYRYDLVRGRPRFWVVSEREPCDCPGWNLETKPYHPELAMGDRLAFSLMVNPVVRQGKKRHDVVMYRKRQMGDWKSEFTHNEVVRDAGVSWLTARAAGMGFQVNPDALRIDGYRQHRFAKPRGARNRGGRPVRFATMDINGVLTVTDPNTLRDSLFQGIGASKGYGCGLMLVRRL